MNKRTEKSNDCIHREILLSPTIPDISLEKYIYVSMSIYILHTCYRHVEHNMMLQCEKNYCNYHYIMA